MRFPRPPSLSLMTKVPLTVTVVVFASALLMGLVVIDRDWNRQKATLETQTLTLARATAAAGRMHIVNGDVWALYRILRQIRERSPADDGLAPVVEAAFLKADGTVLAHSDPRNNPVGLRLKTAARLGAARLQYALKAGSAQLLPDELQSQGYIDAVAPISVDGVPVGLLLLRGSTVGLAAQMKRDAAVVLTFALGLALVMSVFGALISRRMVRPLQELAAGLDAVGRGELPVSRRPRRAGRDEIEQLNRHFGNMVDELAEKKNLERELAQSERMAGLGRFAAGLAHEVNNPLAGMLNCVNILSRRADEPELVRKYVSLLETGMRNISTTMQALLGELRGEKAVTTTCKAGCLQDIEAMVRSEIGDRPIILEWNADISDFRDFAVRCTCPHINQMVMNLATNAIAVMPEGGKITFLSRRIGDSLMIEMGDTGPGMDEATMGKLFEPFYSSRPGGTGLGLWITYRIVQRMGGSIRVYSKPGKGTRFVITLPLVRARDIENGENVHAA